MTALTQTPIDELFEAANSKDLLSFVETLVRVDGNSYNTQDPLIDLTSEISGDSDHDATLAQYSSLIARDDPFGLLVNLANCVIGKPYQVSPFGHLRRFEQSRLIFPSRPAIVAETARSLMAAGFPMAANALVSAFPPNVISACGAGTPALAVPIREAYGAARAFLYSLLHSYWKMRRSFSSRRRMYKMPRFAVLELLVDAVTGLYGFCIHFSNDEVARFTRTQTSTEAVNMDLSTPINFYLGDLWRQTPEWRVGGKRLYEIGLPGRYNRLGEWKPIIYPGEVDAIDAEVRLFSDDDEVRGALFYMITTGHRVIEFVVKSNVELPARNISFGPSCHFWLCPPLNEAEAPDAFRIYDGWVDVARTDADNIGAAISGIAVAVNRLAFAYGTSVRWRIKYSMRTYVTPCAQPSGEDLSMLDSLLRTFPQNEDAVILDAAMEWYSRGVTARNPFEAYLCAYVAIESVAMAVADGTADLGIGYSKEDPARRQAIVAECIRQKLETLYATTPETFVKEAYFDCVISVKRRVQHVVELVFGQEHDYSRALFMKREGFSLSDIRSEIAHGRITLLDRAHEHLVRRRLAELQEIARAFLTRIVFLLKPGEVLPSWSGHYSTVMSFADPRATLVATHEQVFPTNDWRIRPEWCDP